MVQLKKIDRENVWDVARLRVKRAQTDYVSSNIESILEAFATRESGGVAMPFALYDGVALVGFALIGYGDLPGEDNPAISKDNYCLWRLMIDERWQERGYGTQAIESILNYVRQKPSSTNYINPMDINRQPPVSDICQGRSLALE